MKNMSMKQLSLPALIAALAIASCNGGNGTRQEDPVPADSDSTAVPAAGQGGTSVDKEVYGTIGEGTSMNEMEIITDRLDTLYVEFNSSMVNGGTTVGDRVEMLYRQTPEGNKGTLAVNVSALQHLWTRVGTDESLEINAKGMLTTYNLRTAHYDHWSLSNGQLLLRSPKQLGSENAAYTDTFDILQLTADTLVLGRDKTQAVFWREN